TGIGLRREEPPAAASLRCPAVCVPRNGGGGRRGGGACRRSGRAVSAPRERRNCERDRKGEHQPVHACTFRHCEGLLRGKRTAPRNTDTPRGSGKRGPLSGWAASLRSPE